MTISQRRITSIHPFPARMAPEIALEKLRALRPGARVLDPMVGSGTVIRQAAMLGLRAYGCDIDPLAVKITRASVSTVSKAAVISAGERIAREIKSLRDSDFALPWIDDDPETKGFINFWFGLKQRRRLRELAYSLKYGVGASCSPAMRDVLKVALSRIIVTKTGGASLAWDVSHSRPHKVADVNDFDVLEEYFMSCRTVAQRMLTRDEVKHSPIINLCDARSLIHLKANRVDAIITSPPYLNAIDYLRGHRLALVWLGYRLSELRKIRADSIGAERQEPISDIATYSVFECFGSSRNVSPNVRGMLVRYAGDLVKCTLQCAKVLRLGGLAHFVIGNSRIKGGLVKNSDALTAAAEIAGFRLDSVTTRRLPPRLRYLPVSKDPANSLAKRMTSELVLSYSLVRKN